MPFQRLQLGPGKRIPPTTLAVVLTQQPPQGCEFHVVGSKGPRRKMDEDLLITGPVEGNNLPEAVRCAYAWACLHRREILAMFGGIPELIDLTQTDTTYYVDIMSSSAVTKSGSSVK